MNIGIIVPHLGTSQIAFYTTKEINKFIEFNYQHDVVLFFEQLVPPIIQPQCATMCINEIMFFRGKLITTTIDNTTTALRLCESQSNQIIFYVWDLEWMRQGKNNYLYNYNTFTKVNKLIARSHNHAKAIENYCNRPVDQILETFDLKRILQ